MNDRLPVVGIVLDRKVATSGAWRDIEVDSIPHSYVDAIERAGALPLTIPASRAALRSVDEIVASLDGLFLSGGRDIDATLYGQEPREGNDPPVTLRDQLEIALVRAALRVAVPVLGVCRGMQVINVALGGTLHQDLADLEPLTPHRDVVGEFTSHPVTVVPDSRLSRIVSSHKFEIASHHHQAVDRLGDGLCTSAHAPDGIVEALEHVGDAFLLGVEWHPEERDDRAGGELFGAFTDAALARVRTQTQR